VRDSRRWQSTDAAAAAPTNPKISTIVDQISQLTLLETADLVASLKVSSYVYMTGCVAGRVSLKVSTVSWAH
jgi:hypothetical protein